MEAARATIGIQRLARLTARSAACRSKGPSTLIAPTTRIVRPNAMSYPSGPFSRTPNARLLICRTTPNPSALTFLSCSQQSKRRLLRSIRLGPIGTRPSSGSSASFASPVPFPALSALRRSIGTQPAVSFSERADHWWSSRSLRSPRYTRAHRESRLTRKNSCLSGTANDGYIHDKRHMVAQARAAPRIETAHAHLADIRGPGPRQEDVVDVIGRPVLEAVA